VRNFSANAKAEKNTDKSANGIARKLPFDRIVDEIGKAVLGKEKRVKLALTCLFAEGHLLIEDLPGIGKTTLAKALSKSLGLEFQRIQCTSDMLPGDILGISVFEKKTGSFVFHPGPIFTQVLLADEINRATPKTQSALLEAMEERQVTLEGKTRGLDRSFFVIATQNPLEQSGTFPLPESQLDRFLMKISLGYPDRTAEKKLLKTGRTRRALSEIKPILSAKGVLAIQRQVQRVHASDALLDYVRDIMDFTRGSSRFFVGLSPRAGLALLRAAKSHAFIEGRDHVVPEDVQKMLPWTAVHRLRSAGDMGEIAPERLMELLEQVPVP
jgi:MoxR-like ATPase